MADKLVLVTGASGFIATHVVRILQSQGYRVRATVRSLNNEEKVRPLRELCPDAKHPVELVEADLMNEDSWVSAAKDCDYVHHIASPVPLQNPENHDDVIKPAVQGTLSLLKACGESVKRVVLTSSIAAINNVHQDNKNLYTESDWSDLKTTNIAYNKAKTLAEQAAWDYTRNLPENKRFELSVINPGVVFGPVLCGYMAVTALFTKALLVREMPFVPSSGFGCVDVRDVASAHVNAMTEPGAAGHRHILVSDTISFREMALILDGEFRAQGYNVPTYQLPDILLKILAKFNKDLGIVVPGLGKRALFDKTRMTKVLGISPRSSQNAILDMSYSMIEAGFIRRTAKYTGPRYSK